MIVIGEHTPNWSAKLIQFWMPVHALLRFRMPKFTYNHWLIYDEKTGWVWEATDEGVVKRTINEHYSERRFSQHYEIIRMNLNLTGSERSAMIDYLDSQREKKYEFVNFLWHVVYTLTGFWIGAKNDKKQYCIELVARAMNETGKYHIYPFLNPFEFLNQLENLNE